MKFTPHIFIFFFIGLSINFIPNIGYSHQEDSLSDQEIYWNDYQNLIDNEISIFNEHIENRNTHGAMESSHKIGDLYINYLLDVNKAVDYTLETLELAKQLKDDRYQVLALQQMAYIHYSWREIDKCVEHYQEALEVAEKISDYELIAEICVYLATILEEEHRVKQALVYYEKLLSTVNKINPSPKVEFAIGQYYLTQGIPDSTLIYYQSALQGFKQDSNYRWVSYTNSQLAYISLLAGNVDLALSYANTGLETAKKHLCLKEEFDNYLQLSRIYEKKNDFIKSLHFYKKYIELKDSVYSSKNNQNIEFLQLKLKIEEEEKEISNLLNEQKLNNIEIDNKQYLSYILFFGVAMLISIMLLIYYRLRVVRRKNVEIQKSYQNEVSLVQEKETLLKEVHHRVKNNMQIISSLLSLQQSSQTDDKVVELLEQSKYRIQAMAMVHEMLYQKENMGLIHYEGYLNKLGNSLITALKADNCDIELKINAPEIELNIDTAVPLGLIINEILTNSIKYGFKDKTSGTIYVYLENIGNKKLILKIGDNGLGFDFKKEIEKSESLGLQLIETLSEQLNGKVEILPKEGTNYMIAFEEA